MQKISRMFNRWSILVFSGVLILLCVISVIVISLLNGKNKIVGMPTASFLIIPAPTLTPTLDPAMQLTSTPVGETIDGINIGSVVQIHGTDGAGLRLRSGPSTANALKFVALDTELYVVEDGPVEADDYVWWYLVSPYDENRSGWAASAYLSLVTDNP